MYSSQSTRSQLTEGVESFDLEKQKTFTQRQIFVALSRISRINEIYLIGSCNKAVLKVNESAKKDYTRLRSEGLLSYKHILQSQKVQSQ